MWHRRLSETHVAIGPLVFPRRLHGGVALAYAVKPALLYSTNARLVLVDAGVWPKGREAGWQCDSAAQAASETFMSTADRRCNRASKLLFRGVAPWGYFGLRRKNRKIAKISNPCVDQSDLRVPSLRTRGVCLVRVVSVR